MEERKLFPLAWKDVKAFDIQPIPKGFDVAVGRADENMTSKSEYSEMRGAWERGSESCEVGRGRRWYVIPANLPRQSMCP